MFGELTTLVEPQSVGALRLLVSQRHPVLGHCLFVQSCLARALTLASTRCNRACALRAPLITLLSRPMCRGRQHSMAWESAIEKCEF